MQAKAKPGIKAPYHNRPKTYLPEDRFVEVEDSHYYRTMVKDGDLVEATEAEWAAQQKADAEAEAAALAEAQAAADAAAKKAKADAKKAAAAQGSPE